MTNPHPSLGQRASPIAGLFVAAQGIARGRLTLGRYTGVLVGLAAVCIYMSVTEPVFLTWENWENIFRSQAVVFVLAIGMTFVILTAGIDLSIASATAGAAVALGLVIEQGSQWWVGCLVAAAVGLGFGLTNGVMIGIAKIPFFVVTLGTLSIYQSVALLTTPGGQTISLFAYPKFQTLQTIVNGRIGPIPSVLVIYGALYLFAAFVLRYMRFGRSIYAVGSNPEAARLAGINVTLIFVAVYTISGLTAGLGAAVQAGRLTAAASQADPTLMLTVIAAVLIGGTSFTGGDGGLLGTFIGVLFLGVIQNGLQLGDVSTFWQGAVSGLILILAVGLGVLREHGWRVRLRNARGWSRRGTPRAISERAVPTVSASSDRDSVG